MHEMNVIHPNYIVDQESNKTAVVLSIKEWTAILEELEELEDIRAYDAAKNQDQQSIPFEQAIAEISPGS
jgi:hypothetical protein